MGTNTNEVCRMGLGTHTGGNYSPKSKNERKQLNYAIHEAINMKINFKKA